MARNSPSAGVPRNPAKYELASSRLVNTFGNKQGGVDSLDRIKRMRAIGRDERVAHRNHGSFIRRREVRPNLLLTTREVHIVYIESIQTGATFDKDTSRAVVPLPGEIALEQPYYWLRLTAIHRV